MKEATEKRLQKIEIYEPEGSDSSVNPETIFGYVEYYCHELDGSRTILIRTEPRNSIKEFIYNEVIEK